MQTGGEECLDCGRAGLWEEHEAGAGAVVGDLDA
jgi:hypothetical protein